MMRVVALLLIALVVLLPHRPLGAADAPRKIVLLAGTLDASHPRGTHEYEKSVRLLQHCLETSPNVKGIVVETHFNGWPRDEKTLDTADTIVLLSNGSDRKEQDHPLLVGERLSVIGKQMKRGCGLVTIHWSTFFPSTRAGDLMLDWVGGHFDYQSGPAPSHWASAIQHATANVKVGTKEHPICRGVNPFRLREEFYYQIRFRDKDPRLQPILLAPLPGVKKEQVVAWAVERKDGGRGFGFTGGHYFDNWWVPEFRKMVLNAIVWTAHGEVPRDGVASTPPALESFDTSARPIQTLILTGHDGPFHNWRATSKALQEVLQHDTRFKVRIVEDPEFLATGDLQAYDLIVQNYVNWERPGLSDKAKNNLLRYLQAGRGLAVIHFANGAFHFSLPKAKESDWPEYRRIVRRVWDHTRGKSGHDAYGRFHVEIAASKHPITAGMTGFDTVDELYYRQQGDESLPPLITARSRDTGKDEPLAWAYDYGKARIFQTVLGHSADSIRGAGPALLIRRGCVWAAGREQLALKEQGENTSETPEVKLTLAEGKFGKALDARVAPALIQGSDRFRDPPLTVECWAKLFSKKKFNILVASDPKASGRHWEIYSYAGSGAFSAYLPGYTPAEVVSNVDICDGKWHYLAMTCDGKQVQLFVDGKKVKTTALERKTKQGVPRHTDGPLTIGLATDGAQRIECDGLIDEVRLAQVVRTIQNIPTTELPLDEPTVGLWRFDRLDVPAVDPAWTPRPAAGNSPSWEKETDADWIDDRFRTMDTGPFLDATLDYTGSKGKVRVYKATAIRIGDRGEGAVVFDRNQLRLAAGWTGGYLHHSNVRFGLLNIPTPVGAMHFSTANGPGWADPQGKWATTHSPMAPLPREWAKYRGIYLHGKRSILSYTVGDTALLDLPWLETSDGLSVFTRTLDIAPTTKELSLLLFEEAGKRVLPLPEAEGLTIDGLATDNGVTLAGLRTTAGCTLEVVQGKVLLRVAAHREPVRIKVHLWHGKTSASFAKLVKQSKAAENLAALLKGGPGRWGQPLETKGERGADRAPYVIDTLTVPYQNPYRALMFLSGVDFLPDGTIAVCSAHGDVWLVKANERLEKITWKRFATGLYQPLGLKVVAGVIHVLERGQLTRLHDLNKDGEADFYECFNNDWYTGDGTHSFDTCLETDPQGNFYFFKTGDTETPTGGCLLRVSKDGKKSEVFCTGFRHPIGLGISPEGIITGADQEGNWMPATRIDQYRQGGFYGDMRAHHRKVAPTIYDPPLCWLPREVDNSAGGQVWVPKDRFGPLGGHELHLSYGRCKPLLLLRQEVDGVVQGGAIDLGLFCLSGVMRGRFHPAEGHLYLAGLRGWQTAARRDGCLQRIRYTGQPVLLPTALSVHTEGIKLTFSQKLDRAIAEEVARYRIEQWGYRWSADYGSKRWSVAHPNEVGQDPVAVQSATLLPDGQSVFLKIAGLKPVMQMQIAYHLKTTEGTAMVGTLYNTIHKLAPSR